jgi:hypothetical protein
VHGIASSRRFACALGSGARVAGAGARGTRLLARQGQGRGLPELEQETVEARPELVCQWTDAFSFITGLTGEHILSHSVIGNAPV